MNSGSCLCGKVAWKYEGPVSMSVNCHCSMCRKSHGSGYASFAVTPADNFAFVAGQDSTKTYSFAGTEGGRPFCPTCGSIVPSMIGDMAFIPLGSLDNDIEHDLDSHIFVASKAAWLDLDEAAPHFDEYPPGYDFPPTDIGAREPQTEGAVGGSCLCGDVRFEFDGPGDRMVNCHCSRCRKSRSAVFSTQVFVAADRFRWLSGEQGVTTYKVPGAKRFAPAFCKRCGSKTPRVLEDAGLAIIPAGSLDQDPGIRPSAHIFTGSRSASFRFHDNLPQFEEYPPS